MKNDKKKMTRRAMLRGATAALGVAACGSASGAGPARRGPVGKLVQIGQRTRTCNTPLKQQAADDYRRSLAPYGGRLASPIRELFLTARKEEAIHFGVVVIGSGYGASITAARLSKRLRGDQRICILERGKEWIPGTFPDTMSHVMRNTTTSMFGPGAGTTTRPLGLYHLSMNDEINLLAGNGLGGGSLINASIALRPDPEVFMQSRWPMALRDVAVLGPYYDRVASMMSLMRTPFDLTPKIRIRREAAERIRCVPDFFDRPNVSVAYDYRFLDDQMRNPQGMITRPCTLCGDCATGCNVGAKATLAMNYLPVARYNGTEMFTQVEVKSIEKRRGYYRINMEYVDDTHDEITRHPVSVNSRIVVVGAGSPGSAGILLDSQTDWFQFSPRLGYHWSGNGDTIGFVVGLPKGTSIGGFGAYPCVDRRVGPTVTTSLIYGQNADLRKRIVIQDASIPRGVSNLFAALLGDATLDESMVMLALGHDGANGRLVKSKGRWQIKWEGLKESAYRHMVFGEFEKLAAAHGGRYKRLKAFGNNLVSVHPLGGCGMSDDPAHGPINHLGQVYDGRCGGDADPQTGEPAVHEGLYVADASVMPTALGVNPYMTIGALAERTAAHIVNHPVHADLFE